MAKSKRVRPDRECYLCGAVGLYEDEHVFPRCLFSNRTSNILTLPACSNCNRSYSSDDEYFRDFIAWYARLPGPMQTSSLLESSIRGIHRRPARLADEMDRTLRIQVWTDGGPKVGKTFDADRINRVLQRIVQGLYYQYAKSRMPDGTVFLPETPLMTTEKGLPWGPEDESKINYRVMGPIRFGGGVAPDEPGASLWYLNFYNQLFVTMITRGPSWDGEGQVGKDGEARRTSSIMWTPWSR